MAARRTAPLRRRREHLVGVISDTHGLLRPQALDALRGSELIIHAGDIGSPAVLEALSAIAPVSAIRGNNDRDAWARRLPDTSAVGVGGARLYVLHDVHDLDLDPAAAGFAAVIAGHSHRPAIDQRDGVLFVNPGSAGPRRFTLPIAVARLYVSSGPLRAEIIELPWSAEACFRFGVGGVRGRNLTRPPRPPHSGSKLPHSKG